MSIKLDLRRSEQTFGGKFGEELTLSRIVSTNNLGMTATYYQLQSNRNGLIDMFLPEEYQNTDALKKAIIKRLSLVTNQFLRP